MRETPTGLRNALDRLRRPAEHRPNRLERLLERVLPPRSIEILFPSAAERASKIVAATYNIHKCVGTDGRFDPDRIAEVVSEIDADVIALQEADKRIGLRHGLLDLERLERDCGLTLVPVAIRPTSHGWHGNAILVRQGAARRIRRITLPYAEPRGAVMAEIDFAAGPVRVVAAHLGLLKRSRRQQAAALVQALDRATPMPTLLMGDFNEWRPGRPDSPLAELEPFFGPAIHNYPSFPSRRPIFALDRVLGWPRALVEAVTVHDTPLARVASDHLPVKALIDLEVAVPTATVA